MAAACLSDFIPCHFFLHSPQFSHVDLLSLEQVKPVPVLPALALPVPSTLDALHPELYGWLLPITQMVVLFLFSAWYLFVY